MDNLITIYYCHFYLKRKQLINSLHFLQRFFKSVNIVIITNSNIYQIEEIIGKVNNIKIIQGTNKLFDFSAYYEGWLQYPPDISDAVFINDTLFMKYPYKWILKKISNDIEKINENIYGPLAISFSGEYDYILTKNPWSGSSRHICSAIFYTNHYACSIFINLIKECLDIFFPDGKILFQEELGKKYLYVFGKSFYFYLSILLFSSNNSCWKPNIDVQINQKTISQKAICYYLEHRFSGLIEEQNGGIIYINRGKYKLIFSCLLFLKGLVLKILKRFM
jgi:hypothetical protein